jgi:ABC-type uncharacterized transport system permease subunit
VDTILNIALALLPLLYLLATVAYGYLFFGSSKIAGALAQPLLRANLALHLLYLVLLAIRWNQFPAATVAQFLSAAAFSVAAVYAFVEWRSKEPATGFWMVSIAFLFELLSSLLRSPHPPNREILHNPLFAAHASLGLIGFAAFVLAASYGFLFLRLYHELKRSRFSQFFGKLPPLEVLENLMLGALTVGFVALTGVVATGAVWAQQLFAGRWLADPKIAFTLLTWTFYGLTLLLHRSHRWQGRQIAVASLAGFAAVLFSFVAVNLFFTDLHDFL